MERHATANIDRYLAGEEGVNLLYTYRARAFAEALDDACALARVAWVDSVTAAVDEALAADFAAEATEYHRLRLVDVLTSRAATDRAQSAWFDLDALIAAPRPGPLAEYLLKEPSARHFTLTGEQIRMIDGYLDKFGANPGGAGRMLTKVRMTDLLRRTHLAGSCDRPGIVCGIPQTAHVG